MNQARSQWGGGEKDSPPPLLDPNKFILSITVGLTLLMLCFEDTYSEKAPSIKTPTLSKSMNMDIWVAGISNQLFIRVSKTETKFSKK